MFINPTIKRFVIIISLTIISLSIILTLNGPRLISVERQGSLAAATFISRFNTNLSKSEPKITIEPTIDYKTSVQGNVLTIVAKEPLLSNTTYTVRATVADVRGKQTAATLKFQTPKQNIAYLQRLYDGEPDEIYRKIVGEDKVSLIYTDYRINDFAFNGNNEIAVITETKTEDQTNNIIQIVKGKKPTKLDIPKGQPMSVDSTPATSLFAIRTQDPKTFENFLFVYDTKTKFFQEITDGEGNSTHASSVLFAPDGKTIIYQDARDNALYIDELFDDRGVFSFGIVNRLMRYMPDNSGIFVEKTSTEFEFISSNGERKTTNKVPGIIEQMPLLSNMGNVLLRTDYDNGDATQSMIIEKNGETKVELNTKYSEKFIETISISPNDEFTSNYESSQPVIFDGYSFEATPKNNRILIRDLSGLPVDVITGSHLQWL